MDEVARIAVPTAPQSFFSFAERGKLTWWSAIILGLLACGAAASAIYLGVCSSTLQPPSALSVLASAQCAPISPLLLMIPFTWWDAKCHGARAGSVHRCWSQVDCVLLGPYCATPAVLAALKCDVPHGADSQEKYCMLPTTRNGEETTSSMIGGFCTEKATTCAVCVDGDCGDSELVGCAPEEVCGESYSHWKCLNSQG